MSGRSKLKKAASKQAVSGWPPLDEAELHVIVACLRLETVRAEIIADVLGYTPGYVRNLLCRLRKVFGVRENAALTLRAYRLRHRDQEVGVQVVLSTDHST